MEKKEAFIIDGLNGERKLSGEIVVGGAKNEVLKTLASTILFKDEVSISNVPQIEDVARTLEALKNLGATVVKENNNKYRISTAGLNTSVISADIAKKLRASVVLTGPLLARFGSVDFPYPGGCVIGKRPIDMFLDGFKSMGAAVVEADGRFLVKTEGKLKGAEIFLKNQSVTVTETFMMAGVLAEGKTVIKNAALEPEIASLGRFLNEAGAKISGLETSTIEIVGGEMLSGKGLCHETMPDRIEAGSFVILGALCGSDLRISKCEPKHLDALLYNLKESGVNFETGPDHIRVYGNEGRHFKSLDIKTHEYPGFPTDLQAPISILLTQAEGQSFIFETIFENRLNYLEALDRFGASTRILDSHRAFINGPAKLEGRAVESPDLRAGLAYAIAGAVAKGRTEVHNVYYIDRGYERIDERLRAIGLDISRREA